jgi:hypothetical protein
MRLQYTGEAILMPNDVCEAVLRYAQVLASSQGSDLVSVPIIGDDGGLVDAEFLLGPASQLYALPAADGPHDQSNSKAVEELDRRARLLHPTAVIAQVVTNDPETAVDMDM